MPARVDPDDAFVVTASCVTLGPEDEFILVFRYEPVVFDVTEAPTTTVPPTTTPALPPARAPAVPAQPVVAEPAFTG